MNVLTRFSLVISNLKQSLYQMEHDAFQINLLDLPDEILIKIIKNLQETDPFAQTSRKLYALVCDSTKDHNPLDLSYSELVDSKAIGSIANTQRKFNNLTIDLCHCLLVDDYIFEKIEIVIKTFGPRLKKLKLWNSIQAKPSEINENQLCVLLENLPLLEDFVFKNLYVKKSNDIDKKELNLSNLKSMLLDYCIFDTPAVLLKIPKNVVRELTFTFEPNEQYFQEFFNRQGKIRKLELFENEKISFRHLKLHHLKISNNCDFLQMIQQQPNLKYLDFAITWIDDNTFEEVCKLEHLEVFKTLIDPISLRVFRNIVDMPNLKELRLDSHSSHNMRHLEELSMMKGLKLEKLTLLFNERKINSEIVVQMSNNIKCLKHVEVINRSIAILDTFLQNFPLLQSLLFDYFAVFGAPEDTLLISNVDLKHENLTQLVLTNVDVNEQENTMKLLKVAEMCVNLQRLMLSKLVKFTNEHLVEILNHHPHMTHLSIEIDDIFEFNEETFSIISQQGKNLKHFRLNGFKNCQFNFKTLNQLFRSQFPVINLYKYSSHELELIMKKSNTEDWHLGFKLMDHF